MTLVVLIGVLSTVLFIVAFDPKAGTREGDWLFLGAITVAWMAFALWMSRQGR
jgi:multisubunit Na+/H+ antiporter MnhB subunit